MKHLDFILVAGLLLATTSAPTITAQDVTDVDISSSSTLPIKGISMSSDNDYNFKNFEVVASTSNPIQNMSSGVIGGHEYVDLGLPSGTLWATCNIGADSPYDKGLYFAWGEVEPHDCFTWESYEFFEGYDYYPDGSGPVVKVRNIGDDICGTRYDAASHQWGNGWRLPNEKERYELLMSCWNNGLTEENGVKGVRIHGKNGRSIFLPCTGLCDSDENINPIEKDKGFYWTGIDNNVNSGPFETGTTAKSLVIDITGLGSSSSPKAIGFNIRAVINPKEPGVNTGVEEVDSNEDTIIYNDGKLQIEGAAKGRNMSLFDLSGQNICNVVVNDGFFRLQQLPSGMYIVSYINKKGFPVTKKIFIK